MCLSQCDRQHDDAVSEQRTHQHNIQSVIYELAMKHRMSKTEEGKVLKALEESTEKGTQTLNLSGLNQP